MRTGEGIWSSTGGFDRCLFHRLSEVSEARTFVFWIAGGAPALLASYAAQGLSGGANRCSPAKTFDFRLSFIVSSDEYSCVRDDVDVLAYISHKLSLVDGVVGEETEDASEPVLAADPVLRISEGPSFVVTGDNGMSCPVLFDIFISQSNSGVGSPDATVREDFLSLFVESACVNLPK